jgi:DNA-binding CsgD family transcriptional regulator
MECRHRRKDGRILLIAHTIREILDDANGRRMKIDILRDVTEERETVRRLEQRETELEEKTERLEEMNTTLRVLLDEREADRKRMEEDFSSRIKSQILPYLNRIRASGLSGFQKEQVDILAANLMETVRPYRQGIAEKLLHLSPQEVLVVNHIRQGCSSKEIASQLNLSVRTVEFHRNNIRKKLGINSRGINLQTFLAKSLS